MRCRELSDLRHDPLIGFFQNAVFALGDLVAFGPERRSDDQSRVAVLNSCQPVLDACGYHVFPPIRPDDSQPTGTSELVHRVGELNVRSDDIVVPLESRELGGACR